MNGRTNTRMPEHPKARTTLAHTKEKRLNIPRRERGRVGQLFAGQQGGARVGPLAGVDVGGGVLDGDGDAAGALEGRHLHEVADEADHLGHVCRQRVRLGSAVERGALACVRELANLRGEEGPVRWCCCWWWLSGVGGGVWWLPLSSSSSLLLLFARPQQKRQTSPSSQRAAQHAPLTRPPPASPWPR